MKTHQLVALLTSFFLFIEAKGEDTQVIYPSADMWMGNTYSTTAQNGDFIRIGGWGDRYFGFLRFDWSEVDTSKEIESVVLYLKPDKTRNKNSNLVTSATVYLLTTPWNEKRSKITDNLRGYPMGPFNISKNDGMELDITPLYEYWADDPSMNYGILLYPGQNSNQYYHFPSRESKDDNRACVVITYKEEIPDFKLPLPGGKEWVVNTAIGEVLPAGSHHGINHYSIDLGYHSRKNNTVTEEIGIVNVYAAASGMVTKCDYDNYNGYNVTIDHDGDGNVSTGIQTRYLHLAYDPKAPGPVGPALRIGKKVKQGALIGIMGGTPNYERHLHFGIQYKGSGSIDNSILSKIRIDGFKMKSFRVGRFYPSTNTKY